jgi:hypothetical protein
MENNKYLTREKTWRHGHWTLETNVPSDVEIKYGTVATTTP